MDRSSLPRFAPAFVCVAALSLAAGCGDDNGRAPDPADVASTADATDIALSDVSTNDVAADASPMDTGATVDAANDRATTDTTTADATTADATTADATTADVTIADATIADATIADVTIADATITDVTSADVTSADVARTDVTIADVTSADVTSADVTSADAASDGGAGIACATGATCSTGLCLLGRCARYTDESLPLAGVPSPDRCRMQVGVDYPAGSPLRLLTVVAGSTGDTGYESVRTGASWTQRTLSTNVSRYTTPRFDRAPGGALAVDFVWGVTVSLAGRASVMQSGFSDYEAGYSPAGELMAVVKSEGTGTFSHPYPLRLWRATGTTWSGDLVTPNIGTDGGAALHFRADGTPDVLVFGPTRVTLYRKALDAWTATALYTGPGTHAGGAIVLHDPRGGSHVFFGTQVFTVDLSVGELTLDYLYVAPDGTLARRERLPVGGHGFSLRGATLAADGRAYALVVGPASGGRYPTHVVRVDAASVSSSVVANFETATTVCSLAVAPDATMYLAAYQGYTRPVLLRTYTP